jgi:hypothetical protein
MLDRECAKFEKEYLNGNTAQEWVVWAKRLNWLMGHGE